MEKNEETGIVEPQDAPIVEKPSVGRFTDTEKLDFLLIGVGISLILQGLSLAGVLS